MTDSSKPKLDTTELLKVVANADKIAQTHSHEYTTLEHLLASLLQEDNITKALETLKVDIKVVLDELNDVINTQFQKVGPNRFRGLTTASKIVIQLAATRKAVSISQKIEPVDILVEMIRKTSDPHINDLLSESNAVAILLNAGLKPLDLEKYIASKGRVSGPRISNDDMPSGIPGSAPPPDITDEDSAKEFLEQYCVNLNEVAKTGKIDKLIGREDEVFTLIQNSARRSKSNSVLVGNVGTGKTAIVEGLARKIVKKEVPEIIKDATVYALDIGLLMAGTKFRGELEERMTAIIKALTFIKKPILFIDEIHTLMGTGSGSNSSMDVAQMLKPALARGSLRCIGSTDDENFRKHFEKDKALLRRFQKIVVNEPSAADTKLILRGIRPYYEEHHKLKITNEALDAAVDLSVKYITDRFLPDKAIDLIDIAAARQQVVPKKKRKELITAEEIEFEISKIARIPAKTVKENDREKLRTLEDDILKNVYGQETAVKTLVDAVMVSRAGLRPDNKPASCFLMVGPTGVGKTLSAKTLATTLGIPLLKYDMSEFMEKHSVAKLIGSPPGYIGYGDGAAGSGMLVNDIEKAPYSVLLLDEIEKAHPDIFNIFLQVMDDGRLTSSNGKTISFKNVILIMTSNAGAALAEKNAIGFGAEKREGEDDKAITKLFAPEFRNRLDAIVKFTKLKPEHMIKVVEKFIGILSTQVKDQGLTLDVTKQAKEWLAVKGYDPLMGARPLDRLISDNIRTPLGKMMVFNDYPPKTKIKINLNSSKDGLELATVEPKV